MRFNHLLRSIDGVSQKMLSQQLRELIRDGLITRTQYETIPPHVEYQITELAVTLDPIFELLEKWGEEHKESIVHAQEKYDSQSKKLHGRA